MTITDSLSDAPDDPCSTDLVAVHEGVPRGVSADDNARGWRESLNRLAALVQAT